MAKKEPLHPLYIAFLIVMVLIILAGLFMIIWGSTHNTLSVPSLPGSGQLRAPAVRLLHV